MTKRIRNVRGRREKQKHNPQYAKERGKALAKEMVKKKKEDELAKRNDPTRGFF